MWGRGDRQEGQREEAEKGKGINTQTWTQRCGEDLRDQGPDSERVRSPQRVAHKEQGKWKHEEYHT